jgi:hypothetical protein
VWLRDGEDAPSLLYVTSTDPTVTFQRTSADVVDVMVRAHSTVGYFSDFTDELEITVATTDETLAAPDDPTYVTDHSVLVVSWDGLLSGVTPPVNFWHVIIERAPDMDGDPGEFQQVGERSTAGGVTIGDVDMEDVLWVRLTAIDHLGVSGASSNPVGPITVLGVDGDNIVAGSITVNHLSPTIGDDLDISANGSITLIAGNVSDLSDSLDDTNAAVEAQQTVFSVQPDGAHIYSPGGSNELLITDDEIDMQVNGLTITYWNQQVMFVPSAVVTELVVGSIHFQQDGDGTLIRGV